MVTHRNLLASGELKRYWSINWEKKSKTRCWIHFVCRVSIIQSLSYISWKLCTRCVSVYSSLLIDCKTKTRLKYCKWRLQFLHCSCTKILRISFKCFFLAYQCISSCRFAFPKLKTIKYKLNILWRFSLRCVLWTTNNVCRTFNLIYKIKWGKETIIWDVFYWNN